MSPEDFVDSLSAVYKLGNEAGESEVAKRQWAQSMLRLLRPYALKPKVLERAYDSVTRAHKKVYVPLPAICIEACEAAADWLEAAERVKQAEASGTPIRQEPIVDKYTAAKLKADKLLEGDRALAKRAAKGGWIGMLHAFCEKHGRLPHPHELGGLINEAKEMSDLYENAVRDLAQPCDKVTRKRQELVVDMGQRVVKARAELERRFG